MARSCVDALADWARGISSQSSHPQFGRCWSLLWFQFSPGILDNTTGRCIWGRACGNCWREVGGLNQNLKFQTIQASCAWLHWGKPMVVQLSSRILHTLEALNPKKPQAPNNPKAFTAPETHPKPQTRHHKPKGRDQPQADDAGRRWRGKVHAGAPGYTWRLCRSSLVCRGGFIIGLRALWSLYGRGSCSRLTATLCSCP